MLTNHFQNKFAITETGAKNLIAGIIWTTLYNIVIITPFVYAFLFLSDYLDNNNIDTPLFQYGIIAVLILVIMFIVAVAQYNSVYTAVFNESERTRLNIAETLRKLPLAYFGKRNLSDLTSTIMEDCSFNEKIFSHAVPQLYAAFISLTLFIIGLFAFCWQLAIAFFWVVPLALLLVFTSRILMKRSLKKSFDDKRIVSQTIQDGIEHIEDIKAFNCEEDFLNSFDKTLQRYEKGLINTELVCGVLLNLSYVILHLGLVTLLIAGAILLQKNEVSHFQYLIMLVMGSSIYLPIIEVCNNIAMLESLKVRIDRAREIEQMPKQQGAISFRPKHFNISFEKVNFAYLNEQQVLNGVTFTAKQGEVTALIGPSGGGKSTCAKLAARFWDISAGKICLGDVDISTIDPETLLQYYAVVFQDVLLFNNSVYENIRLGRKDASYEEIMNAAHLAQCDEFINKLPQGYDTLIGENGTRLSGGERQRISIARAILKNAPIILLDEATASLDVENESKIQKALSELIKNKTVIVIAHRMRTVMHANKIVVLDNGKVVEEGTPKELVQNPESTFAKMVASQQL